MSKRCVTLRACPFCHDGNLLVARGMRLAFGGSPLHRTVVRMILVVIVAAGTAEERDDLATLNLTHRGFLFFDFRLLACCNHLSENIGVVSIVESELELREVQRQIFLAHFVVCADDSALEQTPESLNRIGVNDAAHVLAAAMAN